jgi:hypothetical protein
MWSYETRHGRSGGGGELCDEKRHDLCSAPNIVSVGKWRWCEWAGCVARVDDPEKNENAHRENVNWRRHSCNRAIDARIILK